MSLHDRTPEASGVNTPATQLAQSTVRLLDALRFGLRNIEYTVSRAPGKAAACTELATTDCQQTVDIHAAMRTLVNAHLPTGISTITDGLVQADVP